MHYFSFLLLLGLALWTFRPLPGQVIHKPQEKETGRINNWKLVWADEFNINGKPNPKNWTYERGFVRNEEQQWYQPENARCENGYLIIEGKREQKPNPNFK